MGSVALGPWTGNPMRALGAPSSQSRIALTFSWVLTVCSALTSLHPLAHFVLLTAS